MTRASVVLILLTLLLLPAGAADPRAQWIAAADKLLTAPPESWQFNWGEGVQMSGLMQVHGRTNDDRYAGYVARWAAHHLPSGVDALLRNTPDSRRQGYCGHWVCGTALLYLYEAKKDPAHLQTARAIAAFIRAGATRSPEGAAAHWLGNYQLWVDTLNMVCPLLSRLSKIDNKPEYLDDAVNQLLVARRHMEEPAKRLYFHMWDWQTDKLVGVLWGRGNGWVIMSLADTFEFLPKTHPRYQELRRMAEAHARALAAVQDADGLWHTVIDDPKSDVECSATTMIAYGMLKLVRLGILPARYRDAARKAWTAVNSRFVQDGVVTGVSGGTGPGDKDSYLKRPLGTFPWGTGSYFMAGAEIDHLR